MRGAWVGGTALAGLRPSPRGVALAVRASLPSTHPSVRRCSSVVATTTQALSWQQMAFASKLAKWSGFCYWPEAELSGLVKAEGLELIASGRTAYTSWFVADGTVAPSALLTAATKRRPATSASPSQAPNLSAAAAAAPPSLQDSPPCGRCRFVFIRGVQWSAPDMHMLSVSSALMNFWPSPLAAPPAPADARAGANPSDAPASEPLVSHTGVTQLAADLYPQLVPYLTERVPTAGGRDGGGPVPLYIAGHSLGGALGMLVMAQLLLARGRPAPSVRCLTFGSPPVLAHRDGGGGHRVLQALGLEDGAVQSFVLEHDPIPRALLTADPTFRALKEYAPARRLLELRAWLADGAALGSLLRGALPEWAHGLLQGGGGDAPGSATPPPAPVFSTGRFVFENVGSVYLIKGGAELVPVGHASDVDQLLQLASSDLLQQPTRALQAWLDHHHASYAHDLETAALAALRRELRARQFAAATAAAAPQPSYAAAPVAPAPSPATADRPASSHGPQEAVEVSRSSQQRVLVTQDAGKER